MGTVLYFFYFVIYGRIWPKFNSVGIIDTLKGSNYLYQKCLPLLFPNLSLIPIFGPCIDWYPLESKFGPTPSILGPGLCKYNFVFSWPTYLRWQLLFNIFCKIHHSFFGDQGLRNRLGEIGKHIHFFLKNVKFLVEAQEILNFPILSINNERYL